MTTPPLLAAQHLEIHIDVEPEHDGQRRILLSGRVGHAPPQLWIVPSWDDLPRLLVEVRQTLERQWMVQATRLAVAPLPNIGSTYIVCYGANAVLDACGHTMERMWRMLLEAPFNGDYVQRKSLRSPADIRTVWRQLHRTHAKHYPLDDLVPLDMTVGDLIPHALP